MNIVIQIGEKDFQKGPWVLDKVMELTGLLTAEDKEWESLMQDAARLAEPEAVPSNTEAPKEKTPAEPLVAEAGAEITVSMEEVRAALAKVSKKHGTAKAKEILTNHHATKVSDLAPRFYAAVRKAAEEVL